uniref:Tropomyosin A n=1 Tax=Schistocephalus solidus TaxID=70667 RepID=A0A0X3PQI7_SCHSO
MGGPHVVDCVKAKIDALKKEQDRLEQELITKTDDIKIEIRAKEAAEAEVAAMTRRIRLLEEDFEQSSGRLTETSTKLEDASKAAEESESARYRLNNQLSADEQQIEELEAAIHAASLATEEAQRNYEETVRRIAVAEKNLEGTQKHAELLEARSIELEERLRVIASELKQKEITRDKNMELEEFYSKQRSLLTEQLNEVSHLIGGRDIPSCCLFKPRIFFGIIIHCGPCSNLRAKLSS